MCNTKLCRAATDTKPPEKSGLVLSGQSPFCWFFFCYAPKFNFNIFTIKLHLLPGPARWILRCVKSQALSCCKRNMFIGNCFVFVTDTGAGVKILFNPVLSKRMFCVMYGRNILQVGPKKQNAIRIIFLRFHIFP